MKQRSLTPRMILVLCAMNMLLAQVMGLHFHRHVLPGASDHGMSLHLRDAGTHLNEHGGHHAATDRASHPDADLEIDPLGTGLAKFSKAWLGPALLVFTIACLFVVRVAPSSGYAPTARRHPALFFLRPPSNAPPHGPSPV